MGRAPCCDKANVKKGPWSPEEDAKLKEYIETYGSGGNWIALPQKAGLRRCGKSCRLRWLNYLRPNIKHGDFSDDEDRIICGLFASIGSRWSIIAAQLPGRTDNDIKNYWNTKLKKKLMGMAVASQKTPQHYSTHPPKILEPSSVISSPAAATMSACNYHTAPTFSFISYDQNQSFSINSSSLSSPSALQIHQEYMHSVNQLPESLVMRFGSEASSSSSDVSSTNRISYNHKEVERDVYRTASNTLDVDLQAHLSYGAVGNHKMEKNIGFYYENSLDYSLEEIKQLISSNLCSNILVDENKSAGEVVYY